MTEVRDQLQRTFGDAYTIECELGGGGMSRVFVAEDARLGRVATEFATSLPLQRGKARNWLQGNTAPTLVSR
jgi:hypothetical protein